MASDNAPPPPDEPKPIMLHARQDVNVNVDLQQRICVFYAAHPDGLLGAYAVVIPINQIKRIAGAIILNEGKSENNQIAQAQEQQRRIRLT